MYSFESNITKCNVYSERYIAELYEEVNGVKKNIASGSQRIFDNIDELFDKLDI